MSDLGMMDTEDDQKSFVRLYNERSAYDDNLEEIINLNKATGAAARVEVDLERGGPLYAYLTIVRAGAVAALMEILTTDPKDSVEIAILQQQALQYREISQHIQGILDDGKDADKFIKEEYGDDGE